MEEAPSKGEGSPPESGGFASSVLLGLLIGPFVSAGLMLLAVYLQLPGFPSDDGLFGVDSSILYAAGSDAAALTIASVIYAGYGLLLGPLVSFFVWWLNRDRGK
ncbi:MAG: hypothetical protein AAF517_21385 [Planctomycetota bacterium]